MKAGRIALVCGLIALACSGRSGQRQPDGEDAAPIGATPAADEPDPDAPAPPCYATPPPNGIYEHADFAVRLAVVGGCVGVEPDGRTINQWHGLLSRVSAQEIALPFIWPHIAYYETPRTVVRASAGGLELIRFGRMEPDSPRPMQPAEPRLRLKASLPSAADATIGLLDHPSPGVRAAALVALLREPHDPQRCVAIEGWAHAAIDQAGGDMALEYLFMHAGDRCLLPAIRHALLGGQASGSAATAFVRLATPAEKAAAILDVVDAELAGAYSSLSELAKYLHPDHCGPTTRQTCLQGTADADLETSLIARVRWDEPSRAEAALVALRLYLGRSRVAPLAAGLGINATCDGLGLVLASLPGSSAALPAEQIGPLLGPLLGRRDCPLQQDHVAFLLAVRLQDGPAPEEAWKLLLDYLNAPTRSAKVRTQVAANLTQYSGCVRASAVANPTAVRVLQLVDLEPCP